MWPQNSNFTHFLMLFIPFLLFYILRQREWSKDQYCLAGSSVCISEATLGQEKRERIWITIKIKTVSRNCSQISWNLWKRNENIAKAQNCPDMKKIELLFWSCSWSWSCSLSWIYFMQVLRGQIANSGSNCGSPTAVFSLFKITDNIRALPQSCALSSAESKGY